LRDVVGDADIFYPQINISTSAKVTKKEFTILYKILIFISKLFIFCSGFKIIVIIYTDFIYS
jgi:hypothetical protein